MEKDFSWVLHDKYFKLTNKNIEVILRNGRMVRGVIVGFFLSGDEGSDQSITKWHIVDEMDAINHGVDGLGKKKGEVIRQRDISEIHFQEDDSIMKF